MGNTLFSACYQDPRAAGGVGVGEDDDLEFRLEDETFEDAGERTFEHMTFESLVLFAKMKLLTDHIGDTMNASGTSNGVTKNPAIP